MMTSYIARFDAQVWIAAIIGVTVCSVAKSIAYMRRRDDTDKT